MPIDRPKPAAPAKPGGASDIDALRARYDDLSKRKTRAEANLENAKDQLEKLKKEARDTWGTDDLEALKSKLAGMRADNEQKTIAYRADLDALEAALRAVEEKHRPAETT